LEAPLLVRKERRAVTVPNVAMSDGNHYNDLVEGMEIFAKRFVTISATIVIATIATAGQQSRFHAPTPDSPRVIGRQWG
jgi:hypothetical protein